MSVCAHCWDLACERARATDALDGITPIYAKILVEQEALGEKSACQSVRSRAVVTGHGVAQLPQLNATPRAGASEGECLDRCGGVHFLKSDTDGPVCATCGWRPTPPPAEGVAMGRLRDRWERIVASAKDGTARIEVEVAGTYDPFARAINALLAAERAERGGTKGGGS